LETENYLQKEIQPDYIRHFQKDKVSLKRPNIRIVCRSLTEGSLGESLKVETQLLLGASLGR